MTRFRRSVAFAGTDHLFAETCAHWFLNSLWCLMAYYRAESVVLRHIYKERVSIGTSPVARIMRWKLPLVSATTLRTRSHASETSCGAGTQSETAAYSWATSVRAMATNGHVLKRAVKLRLALPPKRESKNAGGAHVCRGRPGGEASTREKKRHICHKEEHRNR